MKLNSSEEIAKFLGDNPNTSYIDANGKHYKLDSDVLIVIEPNYYHSLEYVKKIRNDLTVKYKDYPGTIEIEETWELLNNHFDGAVDRFTCDTNNPIALLASLWEFGLYPPPEIMFSIAKAYNHYLTLQGTASLEEVFFGKPQRSTGTYSKQEAKKSAIQMLDFLITCDKKNPSNISNLDRACEVIDMCKLKIDPESLLRKYRRYIENGKRE